MSIYSLRTLLILTRLQTSAMILYGSLWRKSLSRPLSLPSDSLVVIPTVHGFNCSLPFLYKGIQHFGCVTHDEGFPVTAWCATAVTAEGTPTMTDECPDDWGEKFCFKNIAWIGWKFASFKLFFNLFYSLINLKLNIYALHTI